MGHIGRPLQVKRGRLHEVQRPVHLQKLAVVNNEKAGQVRFDFEFDPSLARVWSNPEMASELAGIITNRLLREDNAFDSLDKATEQWWEQADV